MTRASYLPVLRIRIRDWVPFWPLDPGWEKVSIRIRDEQPGSYFLELRNHFFPFFGVKIQILWWGSGIRDGDSSDPGSGMKKNRIRDKHPGSATLLSTLVSIIESYIQYYNLKCSVNTANSHYFIFYFLVGKSVLATPLQCRLFFIWKRCH